MQEGNLGCCKVRGPQVENTPLAAALCGSALRCPSVGRRETSSKPSILHAAPGGRREPAL